MRIRFRAGWLALWLLPLLSQAQATKKVVKSYQNTTMPQAREEFYVLANNHSVRHGAYQLFYSTKDRPLADGFYTQGRKDSLWHYYYGQAGKVQASGHFRNDAQVGVWEFYTYSGKLEQQFDYTRGQLVMNDPAETTITFRAPAGAAPLELNPVYVGGFSSYNWLLSRTMRVPAAVFQRRISGRCVVGFTLGPDGQASNYHVVQPMGFGMEEALLRAVQELAPGWLPATVAGRPVAAEVEIPYEFRMLR